MNGLRRPGRVLAFAVVMMAMAFPLLSACSSPKSDGTAGTPAGLKGRISVSGAFALYPLMVQWADGFHKLHPGVTIDVSAGGAGKGMTDALSGLVDIGMVSRSISQVEVGKGAVYVGSLKDAVIAVVSSRNPVKAELLAKGLTKQQFIDIFVTGKVTNWKQIFPDATASKAGIHVYTRSDSCGAADTWANYLGGKKQDDLRGIGVYGDPGLAETVRRDSSGIGYNNIGYVYDARTGKQLDGLLVVPIDINENGEIDPGENFYGALDDLSMAISADIYPSPPAREENLVTLKEFKGSTREFVKWILTDGQKYATDAGYVPLSPAKAQQYLDQIR